MTHLAFRDITGDTRESWSSAISGVSESGQLSPLRDVTFDSVHLTASRGLTAIPPAPPEYAGEYPDPQAWGDLPAYGLFLRHIDGLVLNDVEIKPELNELRPSIVRIDLVK